jgi:hypothetical protein
MDEESLVLAKRVTTIIIVALVVGPCSVAIYFYYQGYFSPLENEVATEAVEAPQEVEKKVESIKTLLESDAATSSTTPEQTNATVKLLEEDNKANPVDEAEVERRQKEMLKLLESQ